MDPAQVNQILANLTVNARDAIGGTGRITIETRNVDLGEGSVEGAVPGRYVLLAVSDDGCGMDAETRANLFEPFFTTKPHGQGTGLGLATVYGIVRQNAGFIAIDSEPGRGSSFRIYLAAREPQTSATEESPGSAPVPGGTETVLLVEDEEPVLRFSRRWLERLGYTVLAASSASEALRMVEDYAGDIHVLLTDVVMPQISGRELRERLAARRPAMRCVFMSGYTADVIAHQGVLEDDIHFLEKPFSMEALAAKLREALA
jgi:CheY-like chemotaxis protein